MNASTQKSLFDCYEGLITEPKTATATLVPEFRTPPLAANADPETSHRAAEHFVRSGRRAALNSRLLAFLGTCRTPQTFHEIARQVGLEDHGCMKHLNDLRRLKLVKHCSPRVDPFTGRECLTWALVGSPAAGSQAAKARPERSEQLAKTAAIATAPTAALTTCTRCKGAGVRHISMDPDVVLWCDEGSGKPCAQAERARAVNPDAFQTWLKFRARSSSALESQNRISEGCL